MTRGKLFKICRPYITGDYDNDAECNGLVSRSLTALDSERVGEVVLAIGKLGTMKGPENTDLFFCLNVQQGVRGQLIFRAMEARK